ncbi:MAG: hypothetical protein WCC10_04445 [Tumebacillaceae bacterium]
MFAGHAVSRKQLHNDRHVTATVLGVLLGEDEGGANFIGLNP